MDLFPTILTPHVLLIQEDIKICQDCQLPAWGQYHNQISRKTDEELKKLGIIKKWVSSYIEADKKIETITVRHQDNHPKCFNYTLKRVEKIVYEYFEVV